MPLTEENVQRQEKEFIDKGIDFSRTKPRRKKRTNHTMSSISILLLILILIIIMFVDEIYGQDRKSQKMPINHSSPPQGEEKTHPM